MRTVAAFLVHLGALFCMGELTLREAGAKGPLISTVLSAEAAGQRPRGLATLFALPGALAQVDPRLATPPGVASLPALERRWKLHRAQTAELLSDAVIEALAVRLRRHLRGVRRDPVEAVSLPDPR